MPRGRAHLSPVGKARAQCDISWMRPLVASGKSEGAVRRLMDAPTCRQWGKTATVGKARAQCDVGSGRARFPPQSSTRGTRRPQHQREPEKKRRAEQKDASQMRPLVASGKSEGAVRRLMDAPTCRQWGKTAAVGKARAQCDASWMRPLVASRKSQGAVRRGIWPSALPPAILDAGQQAAVTPVRVGERTARGAEGGRNTGESRRKNGARSRRRP